MAAPERAGAINGMLTLASNTVMPITAFAVSLLPLTRETASGGVELDLTVIYLILLLTLVGLFV